MVLFYALIASKLIRICLRIVNLIPDLSCSSIDGLSGIISALKQIGKELSNTHKSFTNSDSIHQTRFQVLLLNRISTGRISNLPSSMVRVSTMMEKSLYPAKLE